MVGIVGSRVQENMVGLSGGVLEDFVLQRWQRMAEVGFFRRREREVMSSSVAEKRLDVVVWL